MTTVSTRKPATRKPSIVSTTPLSEGSRCYGSFTFSDGVTVRQSGGLICSAHGRRHCAHHKEAHNAIIAKAASQEAATAAAMEAAEWYDADYDAWLDVVDASNPLPTPDDDDPEPEPPAPCCSDDRCPGAPASVNAHGIWLCADHAPAFLSMQAELVAALEKLPASRREAADPEPEPSAVPTLISREEAIADFPLLLDIEAEVARIEAEMDLAGFCWSDEARTWVRKPTMAQRAAAALPADHTPETWSLFAEVAR